LQLLNAKNYLVKVNKVLNRTYKEIKKNCLLHAQEEKYGSNSYVCLFFDHLSFSVSS